MTVLKIFGFIFLFPLVAIADISVYFFAHSTIKAENYISFTSMLLDATLDPSR